MKLSFFPDPEPGKTVAFKQHNISTTQALAMSDWLLDVDSRVNEAIKYAKERGFCAQGDAVIVVTGWVKQRKQKHSISINFLVLLSSVLVMVQLILYVLSMPIKPRELTLNIFIYWIFLF